ncbi:MAG: hypothetical protein JWO63_3279, partial [Frankiales bacterium]|nr:hypothetical protein [Frankiales bacterium]
AAPRCGLVRVIAIDGGAAAGKSTLAAELGAALDAPILHTDDLLNGWADQFGFWPRLQHDVLVPLAAGRPGRYRRYDWVRGAFADQVEVPVTPVLLVEGLSSIAACGPAVALGLVLAVGRRERERRWRARDGPLGAAELDWLAAEEPYLAQLAQIAPSPERPLAGTPGEISQLADDWTALSRLRPPIRFPDPARLTGVRPPAGSRGQ